MDCASATFAPISATAAFLSSKLRLKGLPS
jgi:hypothetical protein